MIKSIIISGLFGNAIAHIKFNCTGVNIYVGENGSGKTTILNIIYSVLECDLVRLCRYKFSKVVVNFTGRKSAVLNYDDLVKYNSLVFNKYSLPEYMWIELLNYVSANRNVPATELYKRALRTYPRTFGISKSLIVDTLNYIENGEISDKEKERIDEFENIMSDSLKGYEIMFLPTYRRIEEELESLDIELLNGRFNNNSKKNINFGMNDVKRIIDKVKDEMSSKVQESMRKISSGILTQLVEGRPTIDNEYINDIEVDVMQIILTRLGSDISDEHKNKILNLVEKDELKKQDDYLIHFVTNLIKSYEGQQALEIKIEKFTEIINNYIVSSEKQIRYDKRNIELIIESKRFGEEQPLLDFLSFMSSGEKQILSIFSKLYLDDIDKKYIILFDEPELSLSVYWQERLLPDIVHSGKVAHLFAITHSPFIYDNELCDDAMALSDSIEYKTQKADKK